MVELLVSKNADVNAQGGYFGDLQHHQATAKGYKSMTGWYSLPPGEDSDSDSDVESAILWRCSANDQNQNIVHLFPIKGTGRL
jgi:hypothetical protein